MISKETVTGAFAEEELVPILAVDDKSINLAVLRAVLESLPIQLDCVQSAQEGLAMLLQKKYALVLIDVQMPSMGGIEMATLMRNDPDSAEVPIIFLTAGEDSDMQLFRAYEAGAADYLIKPFQPWMLACKVQVFCDLFRQRCALRMALEERDDYAEKMRRIAMTDSMTGLYNRRYLSEWVEKEMARSMRSGSALTMLSIDADCFKRINDSYGHQVGDDVLIAIAEAMEACIRINEVCARIGGEEFLLVLVDIDEAASVGTAERLREKVAALRFRSEEGEEFNVTTSIGVAQWHPGSSLRDWIKVADDALYHAKENGRNQVALASSVLNEE